MTSLKLAVLATVISTVIGTLMALALVRHEFFGRRAANFLIVIPMATPEVVMGSALLSFFLLLGTFSLGFQTLLIAHVMFCISFVVVVVRSRLIGFDRNLEEAAKDLGASAFETFRLVTLPLIMPGIFGGAMLAFALSIDDFVISNFNSGTTVTFPLYIFGAAQRGIPVEVNVIAMILFFFTVRGDGLRHLAAAAGGKDGLGAARSGDRGRGCRRGRGAGGSRAYGQRPMWKPISSGTFATAEATRPGLRPAISASSFLRMPRRIASPPIQWKGSGGTRGVLASTKARRVCSSSRSRAREARERPTMLLGPTPLPV